MNLCWPDPQLLSLSLANASALRKMYHSAILWLYIYIVVALNVNFFNHNSNIIKFIQQYNILFIYKRKKKKKAINIKKMKKYRSTLVYTYKLLFSHIYSPLKSHLSFAVVAREKLARAFAKRAYIFPHIHERERGIFEISLSLSLSRIYAFVKSR